MQKFLFERHLWLGMAVIIGVFFGVFFGVSALGVYAQDQPPPVVMPPQTPLDQALSERLVSEVYYSVQLRQQAIALQNALQQAQGEIAELKKQLAEKKPSQ